MHSPPVTSLSKLRACDIPRSRQTSEDVDNYGKNCSRDEDKLKKNHSRHAMVEASANTDKYRQT